jgi:hypothetical protein
MKRRPIIFLLILWAGMARAGVIVKSCDGEYTARIDHSGTMLVERGKLTVKYIKIDHDISGGVFSRDDSLLIVYGLPNKIDARYPQTTRLSLYAVSMQPHAIMKEVYGGGIYGVAFSTDQRFVFVENKFGMDVLDVLNKTAKSFDSSHVLGFSTQSCAGADKP